MLVTYRSYSSYCARLMKITRELLLEFRNRYGTNVIPLRETGMKTAWRRLGREHGLALLGYLVLAIALTWPLARNFNTRVIGFGTADVHHSVWMLWHTSQWAQGRQALFTSSAVYAPHGTSLLTDGVGPLSGFASLLFWPWGPAAAYNGVILLGVWFTGYCMYLLARGLGSTSAIAFFAGVVFQITPVHLAGVDGHLEKTFTGFLPLIILALHRALSPRRSRWWAGITGLVALGLALYSGYQFAYSALALVFWTLATLWSVRGQERRTVFNRAVVIALAVGIFTTPLLLLIRGASQGTDVGVNVMSPYFTPDVTQLFLPSFYERTFTLIRPHLGQLHLNAVAYGQPNGWYGPFLETSVTIPLSALALCLVALWRAPRALRPWILFTAIGIVLMLGPTLRLWGATKFTAFKVPVALPYAFVDSLPGLEFMRTPGRFGMITWVGLAIVAAAGLTRVVRRWPNRAIPIVAIASVLLLAESWPAAWPQETLRRVPDFYQQIARDGANYAVLDLPAAAGNKPCDQCWPEFAAIYQMYQITHHKAIAWGYFSHTDGASLFPPLRRLTTDNRDRSSILRVNGTPANGYAGTEDDLWRAGYRYVVWHKTLLRENFGDAVQDTTTPHFIADLFGPDAKPIQEDDLVRVYQLQHDTSPRSLSVASGTNWRDGAPGELWATSPATLVVDTPHSGHANLVITPAAMHDPSSASGLGYRGDLVVTIGGQRMTVPIAVDQATTIPIDLAMGSQTVTLSLAAGNFQPIHYGGVDSTSLSFAVHTVDLRLDSMP